MLHLLKISLLIFKKKNKESDSEFYLKKDAQQSNERQPKKGCLAMQHIQQTLHLETRIWYFQVR